MSASVEWASRCDESKLARCFVAVTPGLEAIVRAELLGFGITGLKDCVGGFEFEATWRELMYINLWSRTASRVLLRVGSFRAAHLSELERQTARVDWGRFIDKDTIVRVSATCRKSKIYHSGAAEERVLRGIGKALGRDVNCSDDDGVDGVHCLSVMLRIERNVAVLSVDSSGKHLHQRGYRINVAKAPLREHLAAAFLLAIGWPRQPAFCDPMAGSGTLAIEAALISMGRAPGLQRHFAFLSWPSTPMAVWHELMGDAHARVNSQCVQPICAYDRDAGAVDAMRANVGRVGAQLQIQCQSLSESLAGLSGHVGGLLFTNPPYGVRIGQERKLYSLYGSLGGAVRRSLQGWDVGIVATNRRLIEHMGCSMKPVTPPVFHGGLRVHLFARRAGLLPAIDDTDTAGES